MTNSPVFLFPGQGSQFVGMGKSLYDAEPKARVLFEEADAVLGRYLSRMCFEGPEEVLKETENTQPALYLCSAAAVQILKDRGVGPAAVAGHSLGEYSALYASGVVDFATGLRLVIARGRAMAEAGRQVPGAMAAVLGLDLEQVDSVCLQVSTDVSKVVVANDNSPGQTVISGHPDAVERACKLALRDGAKRALPLPVSGAFHSPLVQSAQEVMRAEIGQVQLRTPACQLIQNVTARSEAVPESIAENLVAQITSRVRWVEIVRTMAAQGATVALEVGPGKVLAGLVKRIDKDIVVHPAGTAEEISQLAATIQ
ncbi:ACP S-malonyltransferase [bacterium]|nr:ACP S-malonyltransferase [bacterium]